jgi:ribosome-binding protein aMBF1 (putative translation factor)
MISRGLQSPELVRQIGFSISTIRKLMNGDLVPSQRTADRVEDFFGERIFSTPAQWRERRRKNKQAPQRKTKNNG